MKNPTFPSLRKQDEPLSIRLMLTRDVTKAEYSWLKRDFKKGEIVYRYMEYTYGCISKKGIACCFAPATAPFFELPRDALLELNE